MTTFLFLALTIAGIVAFFAFAHWAMRSPRTVDREHPWTPWVSGTDDVGD